MTNLGIRNETVEFKEGKKQFDKGVRALSAMLNSCHRGAVYFGVNESGDVIGLDACDIAAEKIKESLKTYVRPAIEPEISILKTDDDLQYISVSATTTFVPYSFDDRYYIRDGTSNVIASPEQLAALILAGRTDSQSEYVPEPQAHDGLNPNLRKVLNSLRKNNMVKLTEVSRKTGLSLSAVKKDVSELKRRGYVDNIGTNRNSIWIIKKESE